MQRYDKIIKQNNPTCVALGAFDGIHLGHREIISSMIRYAKKTGMESLVFTFSDSPAVLLGKSSARIIRSQSDKLSILEKLGVDKCFSAYFPNFMNISPTDFIEKILIEELNVKAVFCGFNYRFGKCALGDAELLKDVCKKYGTEVFAAEPVCADGDVVSSSRVRDLIESGEMKKANSLLGTPFSLEQKIVEGKHNGRSVGIPTVNQTPPEDFVVPKHGVYASVAVIDGKRYEAITNVGVRPTVGGGKLNYETHIVNGFDEEIYGKAVRVYLLDFVRSERKFSDLQELSKQIKSDIEYIYKNNLYDLYFNLKSGK